MTYGQTLIDKAGEKCGSFYKLHKVTGFSQTTISQIRHEKLKLPLEWVPVLAEIAGVDPVQALARTMENQLPEGSAAKAILGKYLALGDGAMLLGANRTPQGIGAETLKTIYIVYCRLVGLRHMPTAFCPA